jgi:hypothetical protein
MLIVNRDRYRMAVPPGGPGPGAPAAARQYPHDEVVPSGRRELTADDGHRPGAGGRIGGIWAGQERGHIKLIDEPAIDEQAL